VNRRAFLTIVLTLPGLIGWGCRISGGGSTALPRPLLDESGLEIPDGGVLPLSFTASAGRQVNIEVLSSDGQSDIFFQVAAGALDAAGCEGLDDDAAVVAQSEPGGSGIARASFVPDHTGDFTICLTEQGDVVARYDVLVGQERE
jgi:hypothetical protein